MRTDPWRNQRSSFLKVVAVFVIGLLLLLPGCVTTPKYATVAGSVVDRDSGLPVGNAAVIIGNSYAITNSSGRFAIEHALVGKNSIEVLASNYVPFSSPVQVVEGSQTINITLQKTTSKPPKPTGQNAALLTMYGNFGYEAGVAQSFVEIYEDLVGERPLSPEQSREKLAKWGLSALLNQLDILSPGELSTVSRATGTRYLVWIDVRSYSTGSGRLEGVINVYDSVRGEVQPHWVEGKISGGEAGRALSEALAASAVKAVSGKTPGAGIEYLPTTAGLAGTEASLAQRSREYIEGTYRVIYDDHRARRLQRIGARVAAASDRPNLPYSFAIIESKEVNAYSIAGGHIYVTSRLYDMLESDDEIAAVLGHEIAHAALKHSLQQYERNVGLAVFTAVLVIATGDQQVGNTASDIANLVNMGYSYKQEYEADYFGFKYSQKAGYSGEASLEVLNKLLALERSSGGPLIRISMTHPPTESRIGKLNGYVRDLSLASLRLSRI